MRAKTLLVLALPIFLVAIHPSLIGAEDPPEWVTKGPGIFRDGSLYAVGIAQGKGPPSILIRTADNRARANLAAGIKSAVQMIIEDFQASTTATDEMVTRILVYDGVVEVTDLEGTPGTRTILGPGERMMVVVGEGFGEKEAFEVGRELEYWDAWETSPVPNTRE